MVAIKGNIDESTTSKLESEISKFLSSSIILDMTNVAFLSSAGMRVLLSSEKKIKSNGGRLVLVGFSKTIRDTMEMTGLLDLFTYYNNVSDAENALK